jgi:RNA recognition motif-containing protein
MAKKIYVGNLSFTTTEEELKTMFGAHGAVLSAKVINDRDTGKSRGFGFVEMESDAEVQAAIAALNGKEVGGRALRISEAKEREEGGGGNRGPRY